MIIVLAIHITTATLYIGKSWYMRTAFHQECFGGHTIDDLYSSYSSLHNGHITRQIYEIY